MEKKQILKKSNLLKVWTEIQSTDENLRDDLMTKDEVKAQSGELLDCILNALDKDNNIDQDSEAYNKLTDLLSEISISRAHQGYSPREIGMYILSMKEAFNTTLKDTYKDDLKSFSEETLKINKIIDELSILTFETYLKGREEIILRQRDEINEISTPVIKVWEGILALPIIGTLDSARTQIVMENLLNEIAKTESNVAILDISGVPAVDSLVAQHLIKTVNATRLMGATCIISGIKPEIAQTIVHLGINLNDIVTKTTLANALEYALKIRNKKKEIVNKQEN